MPREFRVQECHHKETVMRDIFPSFRRERGFAEEHVLALVHPKLARDQT
jgi:hypothetical protein